MRHSVDFIKYGNEMHHCASIARNNKGYFLVNYWGRECSDSQRVVIGFAENVGKIMSHVDLKSKTGNPIVWSFNNDVYLIYSLFTDATEDGQPINYGHAPVKRWMNCDNYLAKLDFLDGNIVVNDLGKIDGAYGLLGRCQPLVEEDRVLLPLYREEDPISQIWEFTIVDGVPSLKMLSQFGEINNGIISKIAKSGLSIGSLGNGVAIQPSLVKNDGRYYAFCRNVCRPVELNSDSNCMAWVATSDDCIKWSDLKYSGIPNHNNSLIITNREDKDGIAVFNTNRHRNELWLYGMNSKNRVPLHYHFNSNNRSSFSYPNFMWENGDFHVVHTNCGTIAWHYFDEEFMTLSF